MCLFPTLSTGPCLYWTCSGLVYVVTVPVDSYVYETYCVWKIVSVESSFTSVSYNLSIFTSGSYNLSISSSFLYHEDVEGDQYLYIFQVVFCPTRLAKLNLASRPFCLPLLELPDTATGKSIHKCQNHLIEFPFLPENWYSNSLLSWEIYYLPNYLNIYFIYMF